MTSIYDLNDRKAELEKELQNINKQLSNTWLTNESLDMELRKVLSSKYVNADKLLHILANYVYHDFNLKYTDVPEKLRAQLIAYNDKTGAVSKIADSIGFPRMTCTGYSGDSQIMDFVAGIPHLEYIVNEIDDTREFKIQFCKNNMKSNLITLQYGDNDFQFNCSTNEIKSLNNKVSYEVKEFYKRSDWNHLRYSVKSSA
jgi:hypothetical protein